VDEQFQERRLVKRLLAHDQEAFHEFFETYFARLHRFARARLNDDLDATKEIVHVSLSKALRKLHTYRGEAALFTWLCTICRHELSDHFERLAKDRRHFVLTEDFPDIRAAVDSLEAPASDEPEASYRRLEGARLIQVALDRLPTQYGNALEWKYIYGYSVQEIAKELGIGTQAAHSLLARAKRAFQDVYQTLSEPILTGVELEHERQTQ